MKSNCITFSSMIRMGIGNPNSGYNEDIISTIKKIQDPKGDSYPYISGQAIRRMMRERMRDAGFEISPKAEDTGKNKSPYSTAGDPRKYADDDLFGFMNARNRISRTSPVRVSPAIGLFPYNYERDLGIQNNSDIHQDHRMYETEVSSNWLVYSVLLELDRVGSGKGEIKEANSLSDWEVPPEEKMRRIRGILDACLYLWGGGKQSRLLTNSNPAVIAISLQKVKNPIWMGRLSVTYDNKLEEKALSETLDENQPIFEFADVGVDPSFVVSEKFKKTPKAVMEELSRRISKEIWS